MPGDEPVSGGPTRDERAGDEPTNRGPTSGEGAGGGPTSGEGAGDGPTRGERAGDEPTNGELARGGLHRRAMRLEWGTNAWNGLEVFVAVGLGVAARSLALVAFGLDSLVEVFATLVVIRHLGDTREDRGDVRTHRALRRIAAAFWLLAAYLLVSGGRGLAAHDVARHSPAGIAYLAVTAVVMFGLARQKKKVAAAMGSEPLAREAAMTFLDGCLSVGIMAALAANMGLGWWWADAAAAVAVAGLAIREGTESWRQGAPHAEGDAAR